MLYKFFYYIRLDAVWKSVDYMFMMKSVISGNDKSSEIFCNFDF